MEPVREVGVTGHGRVGGWRGVSVVIREWERNDRVQREIYWIGMDGYGGVGQKDVEFDRGEKRLDREIRR